MKFNVFRLTVGTGKSPKYRYYNVLLSSPVSEVKYFDVAKLNFAIRSRIKKPVMSFFDMKRRT